MQWDVIVVGAGAAGLLAATRAAERGRRTLLLEKNRKPGAKILMSGGTRCNLTHACDARGIVEAFGMQGRFLHSALAALSPADLVALFEAEGVAVKTEETGKIFPESDRATDVLAALLRRLERSGCEMALDEPLRGVTRTGDHFQLETSKQKIAAEKIILCVGGKSYPGCGTSGDGYAWAASLGHTIVPPRPALTPITTNERWIAELSGVTIGDVALCVIDPAIEGKRSRLAESRDSFLFTHFGLSGPSPLNVSRAISGHRSPQSLLLECDFLPSTSLDDLMRQLGEELASPGKKQIEGIVARFTPRRLADALTARLGLVERKAAELSKNDRRNVALAIKQTTIPVSGVRGFKKAEVTAGGVSLAEVDSRTMQSKLAPNLYLAGEILDLDGPIGGYNFQAAFSTAWLAGTSV
jgi:hypothetical protein